MKVHVLLRHYNDYEGSETEILGVFSEEEAVKSKIDELVAFPTFSEWADDRTKEFMERLYFPYVPFRKMSLKREVFDQTYTHDDIYKKAFNMRRKLFKKKVREEVIAQQQHKNAYANKLNEIYRDYRDYCWQEYGKTRRDFKEDRVWWSYETHEIEDKPINIDVTTRGQ